MDVTVPVRAGELTESSKANSWRKFIFEERGLTLYTNGIGCDIKEPCLLEIPPKVHCLVRNPTDRDLIFRIIAN